MLLGRDIMKNVVVFGGGTGLSHLLSGLKLFPVNVTAVISVADSGSSTGVLKRELSIPAVGDIGKVMLTMSNANQVLIDLLSYRFDNPSLENHPIRNILMAALIDQKGNLTDAIDFMCKLLKINGRILPITEESIELVGIMSDGSKIIGEENITRSTKKILDISYDKEFTINKEVLKSIKNADLIIFSPGSLYTSIIPHLIIPEINGAINISKAKKLYISNLFTQPGETDDFKVSDHIKIINKYIDLDAVIANDKKIPAKTAKKYESEEQKDQVKIDKKEIEKQNCELISDKLYIFSNDGTIKHDSLKTSYLIFSYLMDGVKK